MLSDDCPSDLLVIMLVILFLLKSTLNQFFF